MPAREVVPPIVKDFGLERRRDLGGMNIEQSAQGRHSAPSIDVVHVGRRAEAIACEVHGAGIEVPGLASMYPVSANRPPIVSQHVLDALDQGGAIDVLGEIHEEL